MTISTPVHTGERSIDRVLAAGVPVLLVFWQRDNAACRQLDPTLDRLAEAYAGRALIARVDAHVEKDLTRRYGISALPGLVFIKGGQVAGQGAGAASESALRAWLNYLLQGGAQPPPLDGPQVALNGHGAEQPRPEPAGAGRATQREALSAPVPVTDATFDQVVARSALPVLVDFWAPWCGPCRMVAPVVDQLAREFAGRALVAKLNVDENQATARRFGIQSIPALYIFRGGRVVQQLLGAQPASVLREALGRQVG